ncbi:recombinase RecT [Pseudalkalibacillus caeni]|uniref:Recombinase RecT n=1 Tax=Exobacillus caeni TaxID=2574798 RepID=A0A5R9F9N1_9BACL|nr:recombinase RecT [Pseudalkalibacillus caeni]TLS38976.1 recombinase RecT [Pseudalkalibacillus caeni]
MANQQSGNGNANKIKQKLAQKAETNPERKNQLSLQDYFERMRPQIEKLLPKQVSAKQLLQIAYTQVRKNPKLQQADIRTLLLAVMQAAELGLKPGVLGEAYLIPFYNSRTGQLEVEFQIGYKGFIQLLYRTGQVASITVQGVYEADDFEAVYGSNQLLYHKPNLDTEDRGRVTKYYIYIRFKDGSESFEVMSRKQIENHMRRFTRSKYEGEIIGPWKEDFDAMAKKTVIKQHLKYLPLSSEIREQVDMDETVRHEVEEEPERTDIIDVPASEQENGKNDEQEEKDDGSE